MDPGLMDLASSPLVAEAGGLHLVIAIAAKLGLQEPPF